MPAAGAAPQPTPDGKPKELPPQMLSIPNMIAEMKKRGVPPEQQYAMVAKALPMVEAQNRAAVQEMGMQLRLSKETEQYLRTRIAEEREARLREQAAKGTKDEQNAAFAVSGKPGSELEKDKLVRQGMPTKSQRTGGGGGGAGAQGASPTSAGYKSAVDDAALDIQAWQYIEKGTLPYRKGTGGGKDANTAVMNRVAKIAGDLGMSPEQIVAQPAEWKANASSLAFQTKKVDAIESVLSSFHNNIETWDNIAKGLPPQLGTEKLKGLGKIDFSQSKTFNDVKMKIQTEFNDPAVAAYMTAAMAVAMDYGRIMQGPQSIASLSEGVRKDAERLIAAGLNDKARAGVLGALEADTAGQLKGSKDQLVKIKSRMDSHGSEKGAAKGGDPPATNAKGWALHTDKNGAKAYVSPDGKDFEEVK